MVGPDLRQDLERLVTQGVPNIAAIERLLDQAEERYRGLFAQSRDAMYFSSVDGRFLDVNEAMVELLGYSRDELMALPVHRIYANPQDRDRFANAVRERGAVRAWEVALVRKGGKRLIGWLSSSVRKDQYGKIVGYQGLIQDLTELRAVQDERDRFFKHSRDLICTVAPNGTFKRINPAFVDILGLPEKAILGGSFFDLIHPEDLNAAQHALASLTDLAAQARGKEPSALEGEGPGRVRFQCRHSAPDGSWRILQWAFSPDLPGHVWYGIGWDITEQKRVEELEREKTLAERSAAMKADFLASMSHELRTPMNAVLGMAHLLSETRLDPVQLDYVRTLESSSVNLLETINNILDYSKLDAGKLEAEHRPFRPRRLMDELLQTFKYSAEQKGIALEGHVEADLPEWLLGDAFRQRQILQNLLSNALKFTEKGTVRWHIGRLDGQLCHTVQDSGIGIPQDRQEAIFDPFAQASESTSRQFGGTGLGLAIVRRLSRLMDGDVELHSRPGEGARFRILLPLEIPEAMDIPGVSPDADKDTQSLGAARILLVEDNAVNRMVVRELLRKRWPDLRLTEATSAEEAQPLLSKASFDAVLMDVMLPGMDGRQLTRWIRERIDGAEHRLPVLGLTAAASYQDQQACLDAGMDTCLSKPVRPSALFRELGNLVLPAGTASNPEPSNGQEEEHSSAGASAAETPQAEAQQAAYHGDRHQAGNGAVALPSSTVPNNAEETQGVRPALNQQVSVPDVNLDYLDQLTAHNAALREELLATMERETPDELERLLSASAEGQWDQVAGYAHHLKSTLQLLGSESLRQQLKAVELDARAHEELDTLPQRIAYLNRAVRLALAEGLRRGRLTAGESSPKRRGNGLMDGAPT